MSKTHLTESLVKKYLYGKLSVRDTGQVARHLDQCGSCHSWVGRRRAAEAIDVVAIAYGGDEAVHHDRSAEVKACSNRLVELSPWLKQAPDSVADDVIAHISHCTVCRLIYTPLMEVLHRPREESLARFREESRVIRKARYMLNQS